MPFYWLRVRQGEYTFAHLDRRLISEVEQGIVHLVGLVIHGNDDEFVRVFAPA